MPRIFKKRPRGFKGTPYRRKAPAPEEIPPSAPTAERPTPKVTASSKAINLSCPSSSDPSGGLHGAAPSLPSTSNAGEPKSRDYVGEMEGNRLVSCERLSQAVSKIGICTKCEAPLTVREDLATRRGLASKLMICCTNVVCNREVAVCDPYSKESESLNTRSVMAMRAIGLGRSSLESFCGLMDMLPPVSPSSYSTHNQLQLASASLEEESENMLATSAHLHQLHGKDLTLVEKTAAEERRIEEEGVSYGAGEF